MDEPYFVLNRNPFKEAITCFDKQVQAAAEVIFLHLLFHANWGDKGDLKRGQIRISLRRLSERTNQPFQTVRTVMKHLKNGLKTERKNTSKTASEGNTLGNTKMMHRVTQNGKILTIENYDVYTKKQGRGNTKNDEGVTQRVTPVIVKDKHKESKPSTPPDGGVAQSAFSLPKTPSVKKPEAGHKEAMGFFAEVAPEIGLLNGNGKPPFSYFGKLLKDYGFDVPVSIFRQFRNAEKTVAMLDHGKGTPEAYFAAACEKEHNRKKQEAQDRADRGEEPVSIFDYDPEGK